MRYFLLALFLLAPLAPAAENFQTYHNPRFDYAIEYPANLLIPQGEADNGDGQVFVSPDQQARFKIYGTHNVLEESIKDLFHKESQDVATGKITKKVTYKRQKNNWFVISGYIGNKIFYQKTLLSNDQFKTFYMEYPETQRHLYDHILGRMASSFKG
ncbi:MAG: hypothetical protein WBJ41_15850 [Chromatiaceae bacterium]